MDDFVTRINVLLVDTFNSILKYEESSLKKALRVPVTITEAHIIEAIGNRQGDETTISDIASYMGIAAPTATVAIKKLESKGFVRRSASARDGRRVIISLTDLGEKIDRAHRLFHRKMVRNISRQLPEDEKDALLRAMDKLSEYFKGRIEARI